MTASPLIKRFQVSLVNNRLYGFAAGFLVLILAGIASLIPPKPPPPQEYRAVGVLSYTNPPPTVTETGQALFELGRSSISAEGSLLNERVVITVMQAFERKDVKKFLEKVEVKLPKEEDVPPLIRVIFTDTDEEEAEQILERLLTEMVEESRLINTSQLRAQIEALTTRLEGAKRDLAAAEQAYYQYLREEGSGLLTAEDGSLFSAISAAQQQQRDLRFQIEGIASQIESITSQLGLSPEQAALASALSADPIIANLRAQLLQVETEITINAKTLRPEHPQMAQLLQQKSSLEQLLTQRAGEVVGTDGVFNAQPRQVRQDSSLDVTRQQLANRLVDLQTQRDALSRQLAIAQQTERQLRADYERFPNKQLEKERLQQELTLKKNFHDFLQAKLVDARTAEAETVGSLAIAQPPVVQEVESTYSPPPGPILILAAGIVGSVVIGFGVVLVLGFLDPHLYTATEIRALFGDRDLPILGEIPLFPPTRRQKTVLPLLIGQNRQYADAYELLRSNIRRLTSQKAKVVLVTSIDDGEGKSVTAYNLAIAAARAGQRTLLLEGDLRASTHAAAVGVTPDSDAQMEPLGYYSSFAASTALVPSVANLYLIPSAGPQPNAAVIIESSELRRLLVNARARFDLVVVDTPSLSLCNDALLLQPLVDGIVIVTQPGVTHSKVAGAMLDQLVEAELPIIGGVINGVEVDNLAAMVAEDRAELLTAPTLSAHPEVRDPRLGADPPTSSSLPPRVRR